jgi:hypothetical protein
MYAPIRETRSFPCRLDFLPYPICFPFLLHDFLSERPGLCLLPFSLFFCIFSLSQELISFLRQCDELFHLLIAVLRCLIQGQPRFRMPGSNLCQLHLRGLNFSCQPLCSFRFGHKIRILYRGGKVVSACPPSFE